LIDNLFLDLLVMSASECGVSWTSIELRGG